MPPAQSVETRVNVKLKSGSVPVTLRTKGPGINLKFDVGVKVKVATPPLAETSKLAPASPVPSAGMVAKVFKSKVKGMNSELA
jgi:hypothetical protein